MMKIRKAYPTRILFVASTFQRLVNRNLRSTSLMIFTPLRFQICIVLMTGDCSGGIGYEIRDSWMHVVSTKAIIFVRVIAPWMHRL